MTVAGIELRIHSTFPLLIGFVACSSFLAGQSAAAVMCSSLLILAAFSSVLLHEYGHALAARRFGVRTRDITLLPIGGVARLERIPDRPDQQLLVALAGPAVSLAIALLLCDLLCLLGGQVSIAGVLNGSGPFLTQLMWVNVSLVVFNLLPAYPMDGGRILRALLAMRMAPGRATRIAARIGQGFAVLFCLAGLFVGPLLVVIAAFVWMAAQAEHASSTAGSGLGDRSVSRDMASHIESVSPIEPLSPAFEAAGRPGAVVSGRGWEQADDHAT